MMMDENNQIENGWAAAGNEHTNANICFQIRFGCFFVQFFEFIERNLLIQYAFLPNSENDTK